MPYRADKIDWNSVDLTRDAKELAAELNCHPSQIYRARKHAGIVLPKKSGGPIYGPRRGAGKGSGGFREGAGRPKKEPMGANVFVRLEANEVEKVDAIAEKQGLTRSKIIRAAVREFIEKEEKKTWGEDQ